MDGSTLLKNAREQLWLNPGYPSEEDCGFGMEDVIEAEQRLKRFAPLIEKLFPETEESRGIIESPLTEAASLAETLGVHGRLFIKRDSDLPIAGSVKARGGIYEVLKHTEDVLVEEERAELLDFDGGCTEERILAIRSALRGRRMQVGSTGNLGMSIGIMSAAL